MSDEHLAYKRPESSCAWPENEAFSMRDEPGEHDPCYLIMPGGAMIPFAHHNTNGVDQARCKFIMDACNAALFGCDLDLTVLAEVIRDAYNRFADMDYFPATKMAEAVEQVVAYRVRERSEPAPNLAGETWIEAVRALMTSARDDLHSSQIASSQHDWKMRPAYPTAEKLSKALALLPRSARQG